MDASKLRIATYNQNCARAGERAWQVESDDDWDHGDVTVHEGTVAEIRAEAASYAANATKQGAGADRYYRAVAATLRDAVEEYPEDD